MHDPEYTMRATDPTREMGLIVIIDGVVEFCADRATANKIAVDALTDARENGYNVTVFVGKLLTQNGAL